MQRAVSQGVDKDLQIAQFMSATGCDDYKLINSLLEQNAWCLELAVDAYKSFRGGGSGGGRGGGGNNIADNINNYQHHHHHHHHHNDNNDINNYQHHQHHHDHHFGGRGGGGGGGRGGGDQIINDIGSPKHVFNPERSNPAIFGNKSLKNQCKAPSYAINLPASTEGWRHAFTVAKEKNKKYVIINVQDEDAFPSQILNRDIWSNKMVADVVNCDFVLVQCWKGGDNYRNLCGAYDGLYHRELPVIMLCDTQAGVELDFKTWNDLRKYASGSNDPTELACATMEYLTNFVDHNDMNRESSWTRSNTDALMSGANSGASANNSGTNSGNINVTTDNNNNNNNSNAAAANSGNTGNNNNANTGDNNNNTTNDVVKVTEPETTPDDSVDTLSAYRVSESGEGILKLRVKLPIGDDLVDWDILVPKTTPQRAFTTGVRYEMKTNRNHPAPAGEFISISIKERGSMTQKVIFKENADEVKADPNSGATLTDAGLASREMVFVEFDK